MDALSEALRQVRVTGALFLSAEMRAPWGYATPAVNGLAPVLAPGTEHLVLFHLITSGQATARVGERELALMPGEIVLLTHGEPHQLWNGEPASLVDTSALLPDLLGGALTRERGGGNGSTTTFICGYVGCDATAARLFLAGLPPLLKAPIRAMASGSWLEQAILQAVRESQAGRPGRAALLARLGEALFIEALCRAMEELPPEQTGWLAAARDPVAGTALALLHRDPARPWTLAEPAREAGASRSVLAERFRRYLGEPPLAYLARWRLQLAARLLETTDETVLGIALNVGYASEAAFNRAFKRQFGLPPGQFRRRHQEMQLSPASAPARARASSSSGSRGEQW